MKGKLNRRKKQKIIVDPWDRDMQLEGAMRFKRILIVKNSIYSRLPLPKRCCSGCLTILEDRDKVRAKDSRGQERVVYFCSRCEIAHQQ